MANNIKKDLNFRDRISTVDEKGKRVFKWSCGFSDKKMEAPKLKEEIKHKEEVAVVDKEVEPLPLVDQKCPKCGHEEQGMKFEW